MVIRDYLGKSVEVIIDRPLGTKHPKHDFSYPINYGYIADTKNSDGEEIDVYVIGPSQLLDNFSGKVIALFHRTNDDDDKLVVSEDLNITDAEIENAVKFQEQWFTHEIWR